LGRGKAVVALSAGPAPLRSEQKEYVGRAQCQPGAWDVLDAASSAVISSTLRAQPGTGTGACPT